MESISNWFQALLLVWFSGEFPSKSGASNQTHLPSTQFNIVREVTANTTYKKQKYSMEDYWNQKVWEGQIQGSLLKIF